MTVSTTGLTNSRRRFEKLAYTPLIVAPPDDNETGDALGAAALVRLLAINDAEMAELDTAIGDRTQKLALATIKKLASAASGRAVLAATSELASIPPTALLGVADGLLTIRTSAREALGRGLLDIDQAYEHAQASARAAASSAATTPSYPSQAHVAVARPDLDSAHARPGGPAVEVKPAPVPSQIARVPQLSLSASAGEAERFSSVQASRRTAVEPIQPRLVSALGPLAATRVSDVLSWAESQPQRLVPLQTLAVKYGFNVVDAPGIVSALEFMDHKIGVVNVFADVLTRRPLQPLGLLHLERLVMTPLDVQRGELLYSLPLAPDEKVTLAHKEWSVHEEQFSQFIEDFLENYSENGVAQADDIAMSSSTQSLHSNALNLSQPLASANGVTVTSPVDATAGGSSTVQNAEAREESMGHSRTVTALASARTIKDQKTSFTVTTVSGMEDFTAHLIENKHHDQSMRIDYFRRVRKWLSKLYRYGVRLTYDVVLPDPGANIRNRQVELERIAQELAAEFSLALTPSDITMFNWKDLADQYGVQLPSPPDETRHVENSLAVDYPPNDEVTIHGTVHTRQKIDQLTLALPDGYVFSSLFALIDVSTWHVTFQNRWVTVLGTGGGGSFSPDAAGYINNVVTFDVTQLPQTGGASVTFWSQYVSSGTLRLVGTLAATDNNIEAWRTRSWLIIRDAAYAKYAGHRSYLRDRQTALLKEIAAEDAVTLRRREKEQIMRCVLEWLFPGFDDAASVLNLPTSPGSLNASAWQSVMEYGEYIKFVQTAIDWDNVIVFLYPYFWDVLSHAEEKLYLEHPDQIHREFLRAGAARVIVAIKPGFEEQVVSLLDLGQLGNLPDHSRFAKAIKDVVDANAAYAASAASGQPADEVKEPGILLGEWTDYTPSGALDIQVATAPVVEAS